MDIYNKQIYELFRVKFSCQINHGRYFDSLKQCNEKNKTSSYELQKKQQHQKDPILVLSYKSKLKKSNYLDEAISLDSEQQQKQHIIYFILLNIESDDRFEGSIDELPIVYSQQKAQQHHYNSNFEISVYKSQQPFPYINKELKLIL
ncbi:unnamed protein product [Paramecium sonneborni]|uniref:Uncharacterized protein n=1 Tax=Paramecium sonneborni TaxID=65129 RepID=A0A8S1QR21_9CILI|nr:unnamed protein product [Paramecium sonneborni]